VYFRHVPDFRLNVTLDPERAAKLPPASVVELLDAIPGAWDRIEAGRRQADAGETIPLDALS
jgi:hypothetical protein